MVKYRKNPVVVDVIQYAGTAESVAELKYFVNGTLEDVDGIFRYDQEEEKYIIRTDEGDMRISVGDYVIRGVKGEFYPCKPDVFKETYTLEEEYEDPLYTANQLSEENKRFKEALEKIATRKMSAYLNVHDMNSDFIKTAKEALKWKLQ
ncbi:hypothetical protein 015DV002_236 [Bacillus phage 015DV002]|nr:hypothetical protein 000TH008_248 [Bacillus phage 000TH008]QQO40941.1 hypothetical protein 000TH009_248 [Bacillus phage 000TH009]QQO41190.1 hypothetical protein 015DV002_236 [Bacillus phage 015DV002]